jgi:hypothetical protein
MGAGAFERRSLEVLPIPVGSERSVGDLEAHSGTWSPDGERITNSRENELFVCNRDGTGSRKLASVAGEVMWPRWSPDARWELFCLPIHSEPKDQHMDATGTARTIPRECFKSRSVEFFSAELLLSCCHLGWQTNLHHRCHRSGRTRRYDLETKHLLPYLPDISGGDLDLSAGTHGRS